MTKYTHLFVLEAGKLQSDKSDCLWNFLKLLVIIW